MELLEEIKDVTDRLNNIEDYCESLSDKLSVEDLKMCDLLHYIENNKVGTFESYRLIKKIKEIRLDRRKIKNDMEISSTFYSNKNKLISKDYRQFLMTELYKKDKQLHSKYNNRFYQEEDIKSILKGDKL